MDSDIAYNSRSNRSFDFKHLRRKETETNLLFWELSVCSICQNLCKRWCLRKWCLLKVESLKQNLRIFSFRGKVMFRSLDIQILIFVTILSISKTVTSWWVMALFVECISECIYWIENHLVMKLVQLVDIAMGNIFRKYFGWFVGLIPTSRLF